MQTTASSIVTDETTRTVTIRQEEYSLQQGNFIKGYHHIIHAATVHIKKGFVNPGCDLTVFAARVLVDRDGGRIDVGGVDGKGYKPGERRDATTYRKGTHDGDDGGGGADGSPGQNGGNITIYAGRVEGGTLDLNAAGGAGGRGQDGGNGKDGAQPPERAKPSVPKMVDVGWDVIDEKHRARKYDWGGDVLKIGDQSFWAAFLLVTHQAATGADGGNGGNAGLAGKPGNGGAGGKISIRVLGNSPQIIGRREFGGGLPGAAAAHGKPGQGAAAGLGARYLYKGDAGAVGIDWSAYDEKSEWDEHWNTRNSKAAFGIRVDHFKDLGVKEEYIVHDGDYKKLKLRAGSGRNGTNGGYGPNGAAKAPAIPTAVQGGSGSFEMKAPEANGAVFRALPYPYLLMLERSATAAQLNRDTKEAADILRWLTLITTPFRSLDAGASEDARNRQRIFSESEQALLTLERGDGESERAVRCIYKDIERYSAFVETSLDHITRQAGYLREYQAAEQNLAERKKAIDNAIAEAEDHITHLSGGPMEPGSIVHTLEKEKQIKIAVSDLDVQILDYKYVLENMPRMLQEEIDAEIRKKTQITLWTALEFIGMAAGVAVNFASAASSIMNMVSKVKDFYKETLDLVAWGDIFKDGIWNREFGSLREDLKKLLETDEWKNTSKETKGFVESVTDFWGKIEAYDEISKSRKSVEFTLDSLDVQASVLVFDIAKLDLKKQRNAFEAFIVAFLDDYSEAREWKHVFSDYFDTSETRFDLLAHLADVQAERRDLEYQRSLCRKNLEILREQRGKLDFDPEKFMAEDVRGSLEANLNLGLEQGLNRIMDEGRAFRIWTLGEHTLPKIPKNLDVEVLRSRFHEPLWAKINSQLSSGTLPAHRDFSDRPVVWRREDYQKQFEEFAKTGRIRLTVGVDEKANIYFERIIDAKVFLRGATIGEDSAFYCVLRHPGISEFLGRDRKVVTCYQEPRSIEFSYIVEGSAPNQKPNYHYPGAIEESFDNSDGIARIRYSPYTTWEILVIRDYKQGTRSKVYNRDIDLSSVEAIELSSDVFFNSFHVAKKRAAAK